MTHYEISDTLEYKDVLLLLLDHLWSCTSHIQHNVPGWRKTMKSGGQWHRGGWQDIGDDAICWYEGSCSSHPSTAVNKNWSVAVDTSRYLTHLPSSCYWKQIFYIITVCLRNAPISSQKARYWPTSSGHPWSCQPVYWRCHPLLLRLLGVWVSCKVVVM